MDLDKVAYIILIPGCFGLLLFFIRKWINDLTITLEKVVATLNALLISLPKEYADKSYTEKSVSKLWDALDKHSDTLARLDEKVKALEKRNV